MGAAASDANHGGWLVVAAPVARSAPVTALRRRRILAAAVTASLLIALLVALGGLVAARHLAETEAVADAASTADLLGSAVITPALSDSLASSNASQAQSARDALDQVVHDRVLTDGVVRVKLWTSDGMIVYSDEPRLVGRTFGLEEDDREALEGGGVRADVTDLTAPENRFERGDGKLLEAYRAVHTPNGTPLLFEVYFRYDRVIERSGQLWTGFAGVTLGSIVLLLVLLLPLVAWLLGRLAREEEARRELLQRALDASADERRRIAGSLHDGVVQDLTGTALALSASARRASTTDPEQSRLLSTAARTVRDGIGSLRTLLVDLYPPSLSGAGLGAALDDLAATARGRGVTVAVDVPNPSGLDDEGERLVFRIAHECLANAAAHSGAAHASVRLAGNVLEIDDDGAGFDAEAVLADPAPGHFGLRLLRDAAVDAGASLELRTLPGAGTRWRLTLPHPGQQP